MRFCRRAVGRRKSAVGGRDADCLEKSDQREDRISENVEGDHSELYAEASEKMLEAIKEHDFSIAEYHRIAGAVIVDDATHQRVIAKIKELRGTPQ